ncbi:hypothetical protein O6H91_15G000100 [Diphasiastrum complanatum]|uniref:Uncharacterized protein n=1 Tax=Diphasiastrum complanatum TaxID=34168 RepID=A0ACC2BEX2_DIPCM|nr:hypothetical protein O6H91_15G000100 [Diphasiastrum complanatum]
MAMAMTTRTTLTGRGGEGEVGLGFNPNDDRRHGSLFFLFLSADPSSPPPPPHRSLLFCPPRLIIRPTNEYALSSPPASLSCTTAALLPPSRGHPRMDVTRKEALWINNNRFNPHWVRARLPVMLQFQQRKPSAFSAHRGSDRLVRMEQLWQEFFIDPSQWWDSRLTKKSPRHPDFKHKRTLEVLWVDGWLNPSWVKAKMASMTLGHIQSGDGLRSRVPDSFCNGDKLSKLCEEGRLKEALHMLELMVQQTTKPPIHAYVCLLKGCSRRKALAEGKKVHALIVQSVLDSNIFLANTLVHMYSKCGSVLHAHKVFKNMPQHNVYSWTAIISAYADSGEGEEAINLFQQMQETGLAPDKVLFVVVLKACASLAGLEQGRKLHSDIIKRSFQSDVVVGSTLVNMYAKWGCTEDARELFDNLSERDVVSWNAMIAGYAQNGLGKEALALYEQMKQEGMQPNNVTFVLLLKACASLAALEQGKQLHSEIMKRGFLSGVAVGNILVDMYAKCGCTEDARELFDNMSERDVISWNAMIAGYAQNGLGKEALALYEQMKQEGVQPDDVTLVLLLKACSGLAALEQGKRLHSEIIKRGFQSDVVVGSTLVNMYAKCGCPEGARELFDNMSERDVVSWTAMIAGYAQNGLGKEALALYEQMKHEGVQPDNVTLVLLLNACASLAALEQGKQLHSVIMKRGFQSDVVVGSTLVDMYAKCGCTEGARELFDNMSERDVVSWNTMIAGYAQNGLGKEALALFEQMQREGTKPNKVTYISVLSACAHSGLVDQGRYFFDSMCKNQGVTPTKEHYACMVDLLGRAGCLADAELFINKMPIQPDIVVWMTLLGAARNHGHAEIGRRAFDRVVQLDPKNAAPYVLLSNIYAAAGKKDELAKIRNQMKEAGVKKMPGCSWIEVDNQLHAFVVGDATHPQSKEIHAELDRLVGLMKMAGYKPNLSFVLDGVEDEEKENALCGHSEKQAIAFGLINTPFGTPIRIKKNRRVCGDCHNASKIISKIVGRDISVMDANRNHHFKDGFCSCGDYW